MKPSWSKTGLPLVPAVWPRLNCISLLFSGVTWVSRMEYGRNALMVPSLKVAIGPTSKGSASEGDSVEVVETLQAVGHDGSL